VLNFFSGAQEFFLFNALGLFSLFCNIGEPLLLCWRSCSCGLGMIVTLLSYPLCLSFFFSFSFFRQTLFLPPTALAHIVLAQSENGQNKA